jgi:hypothetical protein
LRSAFGAGVALLLSVEFDDEELDLSVELEEFDELELSVELGAVLVLLELSVVDGVVVLDELGLAALGSVAVLPVWPAWLLASVLFCASATPRAAIRAVAAAVAVSFIWKLRM